MIGERIKLLRKEKNLTQSELGAILNVSKQSVSAYETDAVIPPSPIVNKMADYFCCTADYILCRTDQRNEIVVRDETYIIDGRRFTKEELLEKIRMAEYLAEYMEKVSKWKPGED